MPTNHSNPVIESMIETRVPRQVRFYDGENMCAGILYGEVVICACCGGTFDVRDILEDAPEGIAPLTLFKNWVDFSEVIKD